jgi:hypothetical protein
VHGLGYHEADVMCETIRKPLMPARGGIRVSKRGLHPDLAIAHLNRTDRYVVRP